MKNVIDATNSVIKYNGIILDRPFVYDIVHNETKLPVFVGMMNHV